MSVSGIGSTSAVRAYSANMVEKAMKSIASGVDAANPSSVAISSTLNSLISSGDSAAANMQNAVSLLQTSNGYMDSLSSDLDMMKKLAVQAQSGTLSAADMASVETQFKALQDDMTSITSNYNAFGSFNGVELFQGGSETIQSGASQSQTITLENPDLSVQSQAPAGTVDTYSYDSSNQVSGSSHTEVRWGDMINSVSGLEVTDSDVIGALDQAIAYVADAQASNATSISNLVSSYSSLATYDANLGAAYSLNADTEMSSGMMALTKALVMNQSENAMRTQANSLNDLAMKWALLG